MGRHCAAFGCTNNTQKPYCKEKNISLHGFPLHDPPRLKKWLINLRRKDFIPSASSSLCSEHFNENDFIYQTFTRTRLLKKGAIPTKFCHNTQDGNSQRTESKIEGRKMPPVQQGKNFKSLIGKKEKQCIKCGFVTFSLHVLYNHKYKCQGQLLGKTAFCVYCKRKFTCITLYRTHKTTCVKKILRKKILRSKLKEKHLKYRKKFKQTTKKFSFSCPICRASFKLKSSFVSHLKQQNCTQQKVKKSSFSARKSFNHVPKTFSSHKNQPSTSKHEDNFYESVNDKRHCCNWCKSVYPSEQLLFMHLEMNEQCGIEYYKSHISNINRKLPSKARKTISVVARKSFPHRKYSEKVFNSKTNFSRGSARKTLASSHKKKSYKASNSDVKSVVNQCPVCGEVFPDTFAFYQHQKLTNHWGKATKSFNSTCKCPFCGKEFLHMKSRNAHVYNHSDKSEKEIKAFLRSCTCSVCSQMFVSEMAKHQHIRIKHSANMINNMEYSSSDSDSNFANSNEYNDKHKMSSVPSSVKKKLRREPNTCPVCLKSFSHSVLRNKHFNEIHLKIFECQFCKTKFKSTSSLYNHIQLSHNRNLVCGACKANFINELQLLQHILKYHPNQDPKKLVSSKLVKGALPKEKLPVAANEAKLRYEKVGFSGVTQRRNIEYYCDVCNIGYQKLCGLQRHRQSKLHKDTLVKNLDAFHKSLSDLPSSPPPYPRVVKQPEIITCSECSEDFTNIKDFVPHRLSHFSVQSKYLKINELNPYMCEICSDVLDSHSKVQLHLFWHLQIESTSNKNTNVGSNRNDTIVPDRLSGQHVAKKSFSKPSNESLQEVVIGGVSKPLFTCEACNIGFTTKVHYNMHIRKLCKKIRPSNKLSASENETGKKSPNVTETGIVHCGNCNFLFSSETKFEQHKEFCAKWDFDNSEEDLNNSDIIKSALNRDSAIAGCITCAALFDNISSVAVHLNIHQTNKNLDSEEIADVLHCALCNCLFSINVFKIHKDFCKIPINNGSKMTNSKHINVLKSALELKCAVVACIACGVPFDDIETFSKHLILHQTNQIQNESDDKRLHNGETTVNAIENENSLDENQTDFLVGDITENLASYEQEHLDSPLDFIDDYPSNSLLEPEDHNSLTFDSKQNNETDDIEGLRNNFSELLCLLISDPELMQRLGYGSEPIDKVLQNVLQQMGQEPYAGNSSNIDIFRKNIQMLLDLCLKDQVLQAIGREKTVDEVVVEALKIFATEENELDDE